MRFHPALFLVPFVLWSCGASNEPRSAFARSNDTTIGPARFASDPNHGGDAGEIGIAEVSWGRLADVYAVDASREERILVAADLVVGPDVRSAERCFEVDTDPITGITSVTVLAPVGTTEFDAAWERLEAGLVPIAEKSLDPGELPPFAMVPRDAAIVVRFDDLIDPSTVSASSIRVSAGAPTVAPFAARVLVDSNHGGWRAGEDGGEPRFLPTRVILDTTISRADALASPTPLKVNPIGLPPSENAAIANVALAVSADVRNAAGNGPAGGSELVRAMRSGGGDDVHHGLLADLTPPRVVGVQGVSVDAVAADPLGGPQDFEVDMTFATLPCATAALARDVLVTPTTMAVVTHDSTPPAAGQLARVRVRVVAGPAPSTGPATLEAAYRPSVDAGRAACFVRFSPAPASPPDAGIATDTQVVARFSEPMDRLTVSGLETFTITNAAIASGPRERVTAKAIANAAQDEFHLVPSVPLDHASGASETYYVNLAAGPDGPTDLAGNPLRDALPQVAFIVDPAAPARATRNYVLRFDSTDEDGNTHPELRGQFLFDLTQGAIRPRSVARFAAVADRTQPVPSLMSPLPFGVNTPLSPLGSRLHALWRYCDVGLALLDESFLNVDVEGLDWAPIGGAVVADSYDRFEISLAHAGFLPDEVLHPISLLPEYPQSGLVATFAQNQLDPVADPLQVVHPRQRGYTVNPADLFVASTGTPMMPWPLNRNLPPDQFEYYTWRDTALQARKGPNGTGAELGIVVEATGTGTAGVPFPAGQVPTIGLPLLVEFKCFPDSAGVGLNLLDASIALNSSSQPHFRAFSTGGTNSFGQPVARDPDLMPTALGGFNPNSTPPGAPTLPLDNVFYLGQMDLVVRVSRVHSVWIDARLANASFAAPVVEPALADQPAGTRVQLAFRGATSVIPLVQRDASVLDPYGDSSVPGAVAFLNGDATWKTSAAQVNGARWVQVRASFVSNAATGLEPRMTAMGLAFAGP